MKRTVTAITSLCLLLSASLALAQQPSETPEDLDPDDAGVVSGDREVAQDPARDRPAPPEQTWERHEIAAADPAPAAELSEAANEREPQQIEKRLLHGFRVGYNFIMNAKERGDGTLDVGPGSDQVKLKSPHSFVIGYEGFYRLVGHSWLNVLLVGNVSVAGLEQSTFIPSANGLLGFEFNESFQLGAGINVTPVKESLTHLVAAAGWTPKVGSFYVPLHFYFIPDKEGFHRTGATIGVTW